MRTAAALLRGLLSLAVLLALLGGLPLLLWWATAIVGPPGLAVLSSLFTTDDSGQVFLLALAAAGWAGWAAFAIAVLLEIPAQLRGRTAPQIRGLVGQRAAAALVGAVLLALPTGTALAVPATAAPAAAATGVSAAAVPGTAAASFSGSTASSEAGSTHVSYVVRDARPAESLWSIAEASLGDGQRWEEIAALNEGRTMPGGLVFHAEKPIQPGWTLHLPADARPAPSDGAAPQQAGSPAPTSIYTVRDGDSLSTIAAEQLGDADQYVHIFELNRGGPLPDGGTFTDPDLIHPGQHLTLPDTANPTPTPATPPPTAPPEPQEASLELAPRPRSPLHRPRRRLPPQPVPRHRQRRPPAPQARRRRSPPPRPYRRPRALPRPRHPCTAGTAASTGR
ncbi:LysM peptidoglycan-binding domain-containing protein [Streptomyces sp. NBC_00162]|uniref:LysM peptidoglycan-binding domain-containing protein n=1 Tax=Streptomyces sp. NBC_00162 TaxID=2903629 RepID=UPI00214C9C72|nr:LysM peptidoglycan-binding domain-containing protein [Streptomyces sp. NBC_00162]UUU37559.1 LysM peptidoglycan-binding domain-containing protein [Streptomyces sp. NBC_00162]